MIGGIDPVETVEVLQVRFSFFLSSYFCPVSFEI